MAVCAGGRPSSQARAWRCTVGSASRSSRHRAMTVRVRQRSSSSAGGVPSVHDVSDRACASASGKQTRAISVHRVAFGSRPRGGPAPPHLFYFFLEVVPEASISEPPNKHPQPGQHVQSLPVPSPRHPPVEPLPLPLLAAREDDVLGVVPPARG